MDLISYLLEKFKQDASNKTTGKANKSEKERINAKLANVETFVEFAKNFLKTSPPVSFDYLTTGNGVTLSNGDRVTFLPDANREQEFQMYTGEIAVTNKNRAGGSDMQPSVSVQV